MTRLPRISKRHSAAAVRTGLTIFNSGGYQAWSGGAQRGMPGV